MFAEIVFPLPFRRSFTYSVPADLTDRLVFGKRVLAPFGKRVLTGVCVAKNTSAGDLAAAKIKEILDVIDPVPIISESDYEFYKWMADYYLCGIGEVLKLCAPFGSDMNTKRQVTAEKEYCGELYAAEKRKNSLKARILQILSEQPSISFKKLQKTAGKKNIYSVTRKLQLIGAITIDLSKPSAKISEKKERCLKLTAPVEHIYEIIPEIERKSANQAAILLKMIEYRNTGVQLKKIVQLLKIKPAMIKPLIKRGLIGVYYKRIVRKYSESFQNDLPDYKLTTAQQAVFNEVNGSVKESKFQAFLLHGVTGSGKTLVYLDLAQEVLSLGKTVLLLLPEISLTPQITSRFYSRFKDKVVVLHSQISPGERFDTWKIIQEGRGRVVIGARSALFAPLNNIGLIIIDEEHDSSFKQQDSPPKYNARDAAIVKAKQAGCPVLLGSATPSVESMYNATTGKYKLLTLTQRADHAVLPEINLINVVEEKKRKRMLNIFSQPLLDRIKDRLQKKEGVIILQNRRGFSTQVYCFDCGEIEFCENCSVALIHHINTNIMQCHYCGFQKPVPSQCNHCGSFSIKYFGAGTERVEDELGFYFPDAVLHRVDSDSIAKKGSLSAILQEFRLGNIDILIGTQMVAKGLDFSRVTLVCVISAETNLWLPDFRADERTFQLLTQVSGRAGRSSAKGEVLIQTQNDRHPVLQRVIRHDYNGFYSQEVIRRENLLYPPFSKICLIEAKDKDEKRVKNAIVDMYNILLSYKQQIHVAPPCTAVISKIRGEFRYQILLKSERKTDPTGSILRQAVLNSYNMFNAKSNYRDVDMFFDIDPQHIM